MSNTTQRHSMEPIQFESKLNQQIVGKTIVGVRYQHIDEQINDWTQIPIVLDLDDGNSIYPMSDSEGNNGGALATTYDGLTSIPTKDS